MSMKKQAIGFYLNVVAVILGVAGLVCTAISSTMTTDNVLSNLATLMIVGIIGILLVIVAAWAPNRWGNHNPLTAISVVGAILLFSYVYGSNIAQRVTLISGLFSFNAGNMEGWSVFYMTIAAVVCFLAAIIVLIVGSFMKSVKE